MAPTKPQPSTIVVPNSSHGALSITY
ncbi:uncharacterized protein G2W53_028832 [Senna tora]|uniref:Uncharacterized protein n=1 Tax=Senna tora TaxID=362788 RepID=A0A834WB46_9FABA|nr:uncharacterized protein G2W53_028832 [Senna tora]